METTPKYPIGGYAPGNYYCTCCTCKKQFQGDKRAVQCEQCATIKYGDFHKTTTRGDDESQDEIWSDATRLIANLFHEVLNKKVTPQFAQDVIKAKFKITRI